MDSNSIPRARRDGLIVQPVDGEVMVYNTRREFVHLLNPTAAQVWEHCDGKQSVREIAARVSVEASAPIDEQTVWFALQQLEQHQLLELAASARPMPAITRREFLTKTALAAALIPAVRTVKTPHLGTNQSGALAASAPKQGPTSA